MRQFATYVRVAPSVRAFGARRRPPRPGLSVCLRLVGLVALVGLMAMPMTTPSAPAGDAPPPEALVARMRAAFAQLDDYACRLVERSFKRADEFSESDYSFKKPHLIKLVGRAGRSRGAVVVLGQDGKPSLRKNGFPVPTFLAREDLRDFARSDFGSLIEEITQMIASGAAATVAAQGDAYALALTRGCVTRRYLVDARLSLPIELREAADGAPVSLTEWRDLRLNVGLTEAVFRP
ncbi:MAG: hypothetical protein CFK52_11895 [Chloracidobacterium sp. CP2_5A]|nr:MAG: hypothetical protein CFK52_11895 [Chloracidobacterium sp. CP2_5A]